MTKDVNVIVHLCTYPQLVKTVWCTHLNGLHSNWFLSNISLQVTTQYYVDKLCYHTCRTSIVSYQVRGGRHEFVQRQKGGQMPPPPPNETPALMATSCTSEQVLSYETRCATYSCIPDTTLPDTPISPRYSVMEWFFTRNSWATLLMAYSAAPPRHNRSPFSGSEAMKAIYVGSSKICAVLLLQQTTLRF